MPVHSTNDPILWLMDGALQGAEEHQDVHIGGCRATERSYSKDGKAQERETPSPVGV